MPRNLDSTLKWNGGSDYVAVATASAQSAAIPAYISVIRVCSTTACHLNIGVSPTAAATDNNGFYLPANVVEYLSVTPGQVVAVIQDTAAGNLSIAYMTR